MDIIFLGTGGGRVNVAHQFRSTAGFLIRGSKNIYVDPGSSVVVQAKLFGVDLEKVDAIFVSHSHLDHANDMNILIEAMTHATSKKRGILVVPKSVIDRTENTGINLSDYHRTLVDDVKIVKPGKSANLGDGIMLVATKAKHDSSDAIGFVLEMDGKRIGYTGDTENFDGLAEQFGGCDILVVNILRADRPWEGHLDRRSAAELIRKAKAKKVILTRFGGEYIRTPAESVAKSIEKETGVRTIASKDGMVVKI